MKKEDRIKAEQDRLLELFQDLDENELKVTEGLISQASFLLVTLEDLQLSIIQNGAVGEYKNGANQFGTKQSAELQAYNTTMRTYNAVVNKLLKIVPRKPVHIETPQEKWERYKKEKEQQFEVDSKIRQLNDFCEQLDAEGGDEYEAEY